MSIKILLLQARHQQDFALREERESFAKLTGLSVAQIVPFDLLTSTPTLLDVKRYDALMVGGSGDYYVSKGNLPGHSAVLELLRAVVEEGHPTFASCFGFQLMVQALGGKIIYDPERMEVGTFPLALTPAGQADALFCTLPPTFQAQLGHKDRAAKLPDGVLNLASSKLSPYQALRIPGKSIWATQFHPELTRETNLGRFKIYMDGYTKTMSPEVIEATLAGFQESHAANALLARFVQLVFGGEPTQIADNL